MKKILTFILLYSYSFSGEVPFKAGESLKYSAQFNLVPVGEAELFVSGIEKFNGIDSYHVSFFAQTKGLANRIFKIHDRIDIWMDKKEFFTHRLKKDINEGSYSKKVDVRFDYDKSIATTKTKEVGIDFKARDPFSMFYYLRVITLIEMKLCHFHPTREGELFIIIYR